MPSGGGWNAAATRLSRGELRTRCGGLGGAASEGSINTRRVLTAGDGTLNILEHVLQGRPEERDGNDDNDSDERDHDAVFDGSGALFFFAKANHKVCVERKHGELLSEYGWLVLHQHNHEASNRLLHSHAI
jgi:hypothetical protein